MNLKERQSRLEVLQLQAGMFKLESTMMRANPKAIINGRMVKVGDIVAHPKRARSRRVRDTKIEARRVVIEHEGTRLES